VQTIWSCIYAQQLQQPCVLHSCSVLVLSADTENLCLNEVFDVLLRVFPEMGSV
jgi:hypothetical protein